jgi:hypothetical protein
MHLGDGCRQLFVGDLAGARRPTQPLVVARPRDPQHPAGQRDIDPQVGIVGELTDQPVDL